MAKQYGLILPNSDKPRVVTRPSIFDEDSDSDEPVNKPTGLKRPPKKQEKITQSKILEEDPTVYQYDEIYDEMDKQRKESKLSRKDLDRKPKYINRLLVAADKRKKENERRIERQVQKEREAEGDEFKGKESFVTSAYRKKLEEMREMEEQEKREEYLEAIGDVTKQGNLDGFYRHLYDQKVNYEDKIKNEEKSKVDDNKETDEKEQSEVDDKVKDEERSKIEDKRLKRKRTYRKREDSDKSEDEQEVKMEHLPSNIDADSDFSIDSSDSEEEKTEETKEVIETAPENEEKKEENKEETRKEDKEPEVEESPQKKPKIDIWKKRTVGEVFVAAVQRYFERKALRDW